MCPKQDADERNVRQVCFKNGPLLTCLTRDHLHSSPLVACKVLSLMRRNDFDIREVTELLEADPALTTFILKLVNSSYFGFSQSVSSLHQAVTLLGSRTLRLAVLSFGLIKQLNDNTPAQICERYWKKSLTMAVAATRIAALDGSVTQDVAYSAGLLSDVGVLAFAQVQTDKYVAIYEQHYQSATLIREEEELFGFNHSDLGAYMLGQWNLPEELCQAVSHHHDPPLSLSGLDFAQLIYLSLTTFNFILEGKIKKICTFLAVLLFLTHAYDVMMTS